MDNQKFQHHTLFQEKYCVNRLINLIRISAVAVAVAAAVVAAAVVAAAAVVDQSIHHSTHTRSCASLIICILYGF